MSFLNKVHKNVQEWQILFYVVVHNLFSTFKHTLETPNVLYQFHLILHNLVIFAIITRKKRVLECFNRAASFLSFISKCCFKTLKWQKHINLFCEIQILLLKTIRKTFYSRNQLKCLWLCCTALNSYLIILFFLLKLLDEKPLFSSFFFRALNSKS